MNKFFKSYYLKGTLLSPVHIGGKEEIDPFEYDIKDNILYILDIPTYIAGLGKKERDDFTTAIEAGNPVKIRKFIRERIDYKKYNVYAVRVSGDIAREYERKKDDRGNQLLIAPFIRNGIKQLPYIPGSSIKGAIRTALINLFVSQKGISKNDFGKRFKLTSRNLERKTLNHYGPDNDPLKAIKITDALLSEGSTIVSEVFNFNPRKIGINQGFNSMDMRKEVTLSQLTGKSIVFDCSMEVLSGMQEAEIIDQKKRREIMHLHKENLSSKAQLW